MAAAEHEELAAARAGDERERVELDLGELELDSGLAVVRWVDELRERVRVHGRVRVRACPQMLAHTLYKAGMLRDGSIELIDVREEEPYG